MRRTMVSLRGFQAPRSSSGVKGGGSDRSSTDTPQAALIPKNSNVAAASPSAKPRTSGKGSRTRSAGSGSSACPSQKSQPDRTSTPRTSTRKRQRRQSSSSSREGCAASHRDSTTSNCSADSSTGVARHESAHVDSKGEDGDRGEAEGSPFKAASSERHRGISISARLLAQPPAIRRMPTAAGRRPVERVVIYPAPAYPPPPTSSNTSTFPESGCGLSNGGLHLPTINHIPTAVVPAATDVVSTSTSDAVAAADPIQTVAPHLSTVASFSAATLTTPDTFSGCSPSAPTPVDASLLLQQQQQRKSNFLLAIEHHHHDEHHALSALFPDEELGSSLPSGFAGSAASTVAVAPELLPLLAAPPPTAALTATASAAADAVPLWIPPPLAPCTPQRDASGLSGHAGDGVVVADAEGISGRQHSGGPPPEQAAIFQSGHSAPMVQAMDLTTTTTTFANTSSNRKPLANACEMENNDACDADEDSERALLGDDDDAADDKGAEGEGEREEVCEFHADIVDIAAADTGMCLPTAAFPAAAPAVESNMDATGCHDVHATGEEEVVEDAETLAREVAEELRMSEDLPFTPSCLTGYSPPVFSQSQPDPSSFATGAGAASARGDIPPPFSLETATTDAGVTAAGHSSPLHVGADSEANNSSKRVTLTGTAIETATATTVVVPSSMVSSSNGSGGSAVASDRTLAMPELLGASVAALMVPPPSHPATTSSSTGPLSTNTITHQRRGRTTFFYYSAPPASSTTSLPPQQEVPCSVPVTPPQPSSTQQGLAEEEEQPHMYQPQESPPEPMSEPEEENMAGGEAAAAAAEFPEEDTLPQGGMSSPLKPLVSFSTDATASALEICTDSGSESFYDLPEAVRVFFATHRRVTKLYDWQHEVLSRPDVRAGHNFVYSLPTSGGKTLVAELSLLRCMLNRRRSCFFVLPFISLADEKTVALQPLGELFGFAVDGHFGSTGRFPLPKAPTIYVCTLEKANSVLNHMLEEGREGEIGAVVVDELHMLGEGKRGATLEMFLAKLLLISNPSTTDSEEGQNAAVTVVVDDDNDGSSPAVLCGPPATPTPVPVQIIGMSATVPNLPVIAKWLRASHYEGTFRPVPLREYSVEGGRVLQGAGEVIERTLDAVTESEALLQLATEYPDSSVLIFCASRQQCVTTANAVKTHLMAGLAARGGAGASGASSGGLQPYFTTAAAALEDSAAFPLLPPNSGSAVAALFSDLHSLDHHEAKALAELVPAGVAFHHGGLLAEERDLIERAYRSKLIRVLCCTSTLAAGVNLPARRVLFRTPYVGRDFLNKSQYMQMCGRAGRAGLDTFGESYLLLGSRDRAQGHRLMQQKLEACESQMLEELEGLMRVVLECVGVRLVRTLADVHALVKFFYCGRAYGPLDGAAAMVFRRHHDEATRRREEGSSGGGAEGNAASVVPPAASPAFHSGSATSPTPACFLPYALRGINTNTSFVSASSAAAAPTLTTAEVRELYEPHEVLHILLEHCVEKLVEAGLVLRTVTALAPTTEEKDTANSTGERPIEPHYSAASSFTMCTGAAARTMQGGRGPAHAHTHVEDASSVLLRPTPFGSSSVRSCFTIEEAVTVRTELEALRTNGLILCDDLHLCYFLTPIREVTDCDWRLYRAALSGLDEARQRIAALLGVSELYINSMACGGTGGLPPTEEGRRIAFTTRRFYVTLILADVLAEVPFSEVQATYNVTAGQLQSLMRSASMFSSSITSFCHAMEWYSLEAVLASFVKRLGFGVKPDLVPLMEIKGVQPPRARTLWNAGFKNATLIAAADPEELVAKVKQLNQADNKSAKFFTVRSAQVLIREAKNLLKAQIMEKRAELEDLNAPK